MVILGLLLILLGVIATLSALFVTGDGTLELLNMDLTAFQIFLIGLVSGAFILWGFTILKFGTKRELKARKERKELEKLSDKLDRVDVERRTDDDRR